MYHGAVTRLLCGQEAAGDRPDDDPKRRAVSTALLDQAAPSAAHPQPPAPSEIVKRSTKRDGLRNRMETFALSHGAPMWSLIQHVGPLERVVNRLLINSACEKASPRPYPLSTEFTYTCWSSLTDRTYNARQLPPVPGTPQTRPPADEVAALFSRGPEMTLCPKSTVLFAYFAQWFTDGFLRSGRPAGTKPGDTPKPSDGPRDLRRNESNPDVDLCQLYGVTREMTNALRSGEGGELKSRWIGDAEFPPRLCGTDGEPLPEFASLRVLGLERVPPERRSQLFAMGSDAGNSHIGYSMVNVLFLREHNRIARELAKAYPAWRDDDDRLFETARNILTVVLIKLTIEEYINHIAPYHFKFKFDPTGFYGERWYQPNRVAAEFNLLYRWHSLIPDALRVGGEERSIDGTVFNNALIMEHGLGPMFDDASRQRAGKVCLFNTSKWFADRTTKQSIEQARRLDLATYNAYREDCGFPAVTAFDQISSDSRVCAGLERVYRHVDNIEFYIGLFAEDARPNSVLPSLLGRMVGMHAFSQLMTNPLLAPGIYGEATFSAKGMEMIEETTSLSQLLHRNIGESADACFEVRLTRKGWTRE
jgi:prostaglandin-endoperoxide synthase 2